MALEMKSHCEDCGAVLGGAAEAWICSFECTWCPNCAGGLNYRCPNCRGELTRRPRRDQSPDEGA